jgi:hypothetical protein
MGGGGAFIPKPFLPIPNPGTREPETPAVFFTKKIPVLPMTDFSINDF